MLFITHLLAGILLANLLGHWRWIILGSVIIDLDHFIVLFRKKVYNPIKMIKHICDEEKYGSHRTKLHSLLGLVVIFFAIASFNLEIAKYFSIALFFHLVLDALDGSSIRLFYPLPKTVKGPIWGMTKKEAILCTLLIIATIAIRTNIF
jgi:membrane-bound metal-dependent hydrolase YbcI (DUF457 family)